MGVIKISIEKDIEKIIADELVALDRPDLFRAPLVAFSKASDSRYPKLKEIVGEWHLNPDELLPDVKSVISYFVPFTKEVIEGPCSVADSSAIWGEAYDVINEYFEHIGDAICQYLTENGFSAKKISATSEFDPKSPEPILSHRSAAAIAGLGEFGVNHMLITEKGSGGRYCTVLTSADLKSEEKSLKNQCLYVENGTCGLCFTKCPANALTPDFFDKPACQDEIDKYGERQKGILKYGAATCGKCISVCPVAYIE